MAKKLLKERFQELAGIKPLYEIKKSFHRWIDFEEHPAQETDKYEWVKSNKSSIPRFEEFAGINNSGGIELSNLIKSYGDYVRDNVDKRDFGKYLGDNVVAHFKHLYLTKVNRISDPKLRNKFQNIKFVNGLPDSKEYTHLVNELEFQKITLKFHDMVDEFMGTSKQEYIPLLVPYILYIFNTEVWNKNYDGSLPGEL